MTRPFMKKTLLTALATLMISSSLYAAYPISMTNGYASGTKLANLVQLKSNNENDGVENDYASYFFVKLTTHLPGATSQKIAESFSSLAKDSTQFLANGSKTEMLEEAIKNLKAINGFQHLNDDEAAYAFIVANDMLN